VSILAEGDGLTVDEGDQHLLTHRFAGHVGECTIVEDVAVLQHLDKRRFLMRGALVKISCIPNRSMSWVRATKVAPAPSATTSG
jgi:hypothetical protein